jgi:hypothetical protein
MREKLKASIKSRLNTEISPRNPLKFLKNYDIDEYLDTLISVVYLHTRAKKGNRNAALYLTEMVAAIKKRLGSCR